MTPPPTNTASKLLLLAHSIASAGITRIRFRRSVASMPPSQPSRAPVTSPMLPPGTVAKPASGAARLIIRAMSLAPPEGARTAAPRAPAHRPPLLRLRRASRRRGPGSAAARRAQRRRRHRPAAREAARARGRSTAPPPPSAASADTYSALFIVNDDPDLARVCDADGVHVGQDDASVEAARELLGADAIIGLSTHSPEQIAAADERADRLHQRRAGLGDADESGPAGGRAGARLARRRAARTQPFFAIGGIDPCNAERGGRAPARGGSAWCGRSATRPTRAPRRPRCAEPSRPPRARRRAARTT